MTDATDDPPLAILAPARKLRAAAARIAELEAEVAALTASAHTGERMARAIEGVIEKSARDRHRVCVAVGEFDELVAAYRSTRAPEPMAGEVERWKLVPVEPTEAMYEASNREWDGRMSARSCGVWQAMLAASPPPPDGWREPRD